MRLSSASGTKAKAHVDVEHLGLDGEVFPGSMMGGTMLSHPSGSASPQTPHCNLTQGILAMPQHLLVVPCPFPATHGTSQFHRGISWPWQLLAVSLCLLIMLWQLLKMSWHLQATPWHLLATPWHLPDTSWPLLAPPSTGGSLPCLEALSSLSLPGLFPFQLPKSQRGGKGLGSSPEPWVVRAGPAPIAQLSSEHSL